MDPNEIIPKSYDYHLVVRSGFISILTARGVLLLSFATKRRVP